MIFHTAGYGVTMESLASTAANFMGGVRPEVIAFVGGGKKRKNKRSSRVKKSNRKIKRSTKVKRKNKRSSSIKRKSDVKVLTKNDRKKRLKQRLNDRKIRRSIIKDIESGKHENAKEKMKLLSKSNNSMISFLSSIEPSYIPLSDKPNSTGPASLRLSKMTSSTKKRSKKRKSSKK